MLKTHLKTSLFLMALLFASFTAAKAPTSFPLKDLPAKTLRGDAPDLSKAKLILVDFWASWCTPCLAALPFYDELQTKYRDQGVVFLSYSEDDSVADARKLLKKVSFSFPAYWDEGRKLASQLQIESIPVLLVLNREGKILATERGFTEKKRKELPQKIEDWLKQAR